MPRLTKRAVEGAETRAADYFMWCDDLPGFGVRILPSGKRSYLVQYRAGGRSRRAVIGLHGRLTCDEARKEAAALLGQVAKGGDPAEERVTQRQAMTVAELCQRYRDAAEKGLILGKRGGPKKPMTLRYDIARMENHVIPLLGRRRVRDLTHADIAKFIRDVASAKTAGEPEKTDKLRGKRIVRGGRGVATRTAGMLGGILSFAVSEGVITTNPAHGVRKPAYERRRDRLDAEGFRALGAALAAKAGEGMNASAIAAVRLLALTGCRRSEIVGLRWAEVDASGHALRLADSKEGASVRPIGEAALALLAGLPRADSAVWVFPGERRDLPYGGLKGAWRHIIAAAGLDISPHVLRHSFASVAGDLGYSESTIAALLGHAAGSVTGRYTHHLDAVLIAAADKVSAEIAKFL